MASEAVHQRLRALLAAELGPAADGIVQDIARSSTRHDVLEGLVILLEELAEQAPKASRAAIAAFPELQRRDLWAQVLSWMDLGVALGATSGAVALRYFKESPLLLGLMAPGQREAVLEAALELADAEPNLAWEFCRVAPEIVTILPAPADWAGWMDVAAELAQRDFTLAVEFVRQIPSVAQVLPVQESRTWVDLGMTLITQNSLGKPDYLGVLEFFRTSPAILGDVPETDARSLVIALGAQAAKQSPESAITLFSEAPAILRRLPDREWQLNTLRYGLLVAERDAQAAVAYLRRCPELAALIGAGADSGQKFQAWLSAGMEVLQYSNEAGRAYFAVETEKALGAVSEALSGVPLRRIARRVKLFVEALCGKDVRIHEIPDQLESTPRITRAAVADDGRSIGLPSLIRRYPDFEDNVRLYMVMAAHEAGHLEFGTFDLSLTRLSDLAQDLEKRYSKGGREPVRRLSDLFARYPQPGLMRDLWTVVEDTRIEFLLRAEYPGLSRDLSRVAQDALSVRTFSHGVTIREMVVDQLLLLSTAEAATEALSCPAGIRAEVERLWSLLQGIRNANATAEDAVRLADRLYGDMDAMFARRAEMIGGDAASEPVIDLLPAPRASEDLSDTYQPMLNWDYRGVMDPDLVRDRRETSPQTGPVGTQGDTTEGAGLAGSSSGGGTSGAGTARSREASSDLLAPGRRQPSMVEELLAVEGEPPPQDQNLVAGGTVTLYREWDAAIRDFRMNWCQVHEREADEGSTEFVEEVLTAQRGAVGIMRRYFESLRPPGLRRVAGQVDGEELDMDAAVCRVADLAAGREPSERIYLRREKRERDVAVAFLVDLSGSTSRQIEQGRRVIDVEKQGLVILCEALTSIGDQFAVYGYSGQGRHRVEFIVIKDFDEAVTGRAAAKLGGVVPLQQNRDGAAIRHATRKLLARHAKTRLLIVLSDGRPLDEGYKDEYSLEDTRMALHEARAQGIEPVCITVDREADAYVRRMYGDVRFVVVDRVEGLPEKLPRIYHRLTA
ncbi:MAG TPA: VWA domain-containing protein [Nitrospiraceae bacterium]|nr:VWA domain-containing protein [Nitrospiraceae bacterium]